MKKTLAIILTLVMLFTSFPVIGASAATITGLSKETPLAVNPTSSGTFVWNNFTDWDTDKLWFNFTLPQRGVLNFNCNKLADVTGDTDSIYFYLYKSVDTENAIWEDSHYNYESVVGNYNFNIPLNAGTYYFVLDTNLYKEYRQLNYAFKFTANSSYEIEPNNGPNIATSVALNKTIYGYTGYTGYDYYSVSVTKDTPVRLKIGNFAKLEENNVYVDITFADGTTDYMSGNDVVAASGYSYIDVLMKKGNNIIKVGNKTPSMQYYVCPSTSISYAVPTIKSVKVESSYTTGIYWNVVNAIDGYEVYQKIGTGRWNLVKDLNYYSYEGVRLYNYDANKAYQFKVRTYKLFGTTKYYSDWSKVVYLNPTPKNIKMSSSALVYTGKVRKPTFTIKDVNGKKLTQGTHYTVSYSKGCKNIGTYKATITFKGVYSGKVTRSFTIVPKATTVSKVTPGKKNLKVTWKKQATQTTGYQIQLSTSSSFKSGNKTVNITKNKTVSTTVKNLKANKKYYVRVRTYKTVNGAKYYSAWSKALNKKTK